jgi:4-carboxymuconolactone decarboxylase
MLEFPVLKKVDLDERQLSLWNELTLGPRGFYCGGAEAMRVPDLYNAWLQFPEFGQLMIRLGDEIRSKSELPGKYRELIVLTTSALLGAWVEFDFHVPFAVNEGLPDSLITALRSGSRPHFDDTTEAVVHDANTQLLRTGTLTVETRERLIGALGFRGVMQLVAALTLYVVTAYTTNIARVKLAEDFSADPEKLKCFFAGGSPSGEAR